MYNESARVKPGIFNTKLRQNIPHAYFCSKLINLDTQNLLLVLIIVVFVAAGAFYLMFAKNGKESRADNISTNSGTLQMQLQAYERLILLTERIALPNLIARITQHGASARELQQMLVHNIKEEFNYNITQQIYVSADAWTAVKTLKEQNTLIINQFANVLPPNATGLDLSKMLLEYLMTDKKGALHEVVSEVLSYEAKKLL